MFKKAPAPLALSRYRPITAYLVRSSYLKSILARYEFADGLGRYKILGDVDQLAPGIEGIGPDLNFPTHDAE